MSDERAREAAEAWARSDASMSLCDCSGHEPGTVRMRGDCAVCSFLAGSQRGLVAGLELARDSLLDFRRPGFFYTMDERSRILKILDGEIEKVKHG